MFHEVGPEEQNARGHMEAVSELGTKSLSSEERRCGRPDKVDRRTHAVIIMYDLSEMAAIKLQSAVGPTVTVVRRTVYFLYLLVLQILAFILLCAELYSGVQSCTAIHAPRPQAADGGAASRYRG